MAFLVVKRSIRPDVARSKTPLAYGHCPACTRPSYTGDMNDGPTWKAGDSQLVSVCAL
ncbi:hypothetical protein B0T12DRAFT_421198 [Alternaria alternata]|nr:hypothetical protein B0T12DRAFT_421198 [Alternaria alternata]